MGVKRPHKKKYQIFIIPILAVGLSLLTGAILILVLGKNPLSAYENLLQGVGLLRKEKYPAGKSMLTDFLSLLDYWTPMIFAALAVTVALKAGLLNIGVSGQMLAAGFAASVMIGYSNLTASVAKPLVVVLSLSVGAFLGGLLGGLKHKFYMNEVVSSIMLNYIIEYAVAFFLYENYINPVSRQSEKVSEAARLTLKNIELGKSKADIPLGIILAVLAVIVIKYVLDKTIFGYEGKAIGSNPYASYYAGMNIGKNRVLVMMLSGGLAGLAGAVYYLGYLDSIQPKMLSSIGYDAVAVALLGNANPFGILLSSFVISIMNKGNAYMSSKAGLDGEIISVITGFILLFSACGEYMNQRISKKKITEKG